MIDLTTASMSHSKREQSQKDIVNIDYISLKINISNIFYKDRKKLRTFLIQVNIYIQFNTQKLRITEVKIIFAVTYLRNKAFN